MTGLQSVRFLFDFALVGMGVLGIIVEPIMLSGDQGSYWFGRHWSCGIQSSWFFILGPLKYRAWLAWRLNSTAIASQSQLPDIVWYSWILELFLLRRLLAVHVMQRTTIAFPDSLPPLAGAETPFAKILVVRSFRLLRLVRVNHSDLGSFRSQKSKKNHCRKGEWFTVEGLVMTIWLTCPYECYQLPMLPQGNTNATHVPHRLALGLWLAHIWQCHAVDLLYPLTDLVHLRMFRHWIIGSS